MKVALVHDWFIGLGGAEQVFRQMHLCYPEADIFSLIDFLNEEDRDYIMLGKTSKVSYLQKVPFVRKNYRFLFPFFHHAIEKFDLSRYDLNPFVFACGGQRNKGT